MCRTRCAGTAPGAAGRGSSSALSWLLVISACLACYTNKKTAFAPTLNPALKPSFGGFAAFACFAEADGKVLSQLGTALEKSNF